MIFYRLVLLIQIWKDMLRMDIKQNLTNVRIYDCMDLSLCQVHCCKYGEQIKKRPCCHSIVHFYAVFSTRSKICTQKRLTIYFWNNSQSKKFQILIEWNLQHIGRRIGIRFLLLHELGSNVLYVQKHFQNFW